ncbi:hypothetical protein, partial [Vibrio parahaemolyticus]|uniref:hypothetical protein n=1 Tax=Vibrio parahaemolyticus TaxID=670 RepID=UPI001A8EA1F4
MRVSYWIDRYAETFDILCQTRIQRWIETVRESDRISTTIPDVFVWNGQHPDHRWADVHIE